MNKKLLAAAVASAVAMPGVVAADMTIYGSVKPRITVQDSNITMSDDANGDLLIITSISLLSFKADILYGFVD